MPATPEPAARGPVLWLVVLLASGGAELPPGQRLVLRELPTDAGPAEVALQSRFEDAGLTDLLARELILEVRCPAQHADEAVARASVVAANLVPLLSFAVNAHVPAPSPYLAYEVQPGLSRRRFWQAQATFAGGMPRPTRILRQELLFPFLEAVLAAGAAPRLHRALGQYHAALQNWTAGGRVVAMAHLYMALEALGPLSEAAARARLGLPDQLAHARHRGVDVERSNWK